MANANRPSGLSPVKHLITGNYNGQANVYSIAAADTNGYAIGDPAASSGSSDANGVAGITLATAGTGNAVRGVIVGLGTSESGIFNPNNLNSTVRPAAAQSSVWYALVVDDPNVIFEIQEVGTGTALTAAAVGNNANLLAGTNNGYQSGWLLNNSGVTTTNTLQLRLLGLARRSDNAFGYYAKWLVKINNHELAAGTAGV